MEYILILTIVFLLIIIFGIFYLLLYQKSKIIYYKGHTDYLQSENKYLKTVNKTLLEGLEEFTKKKKKND